MGKTFALDVSKFVAKANGNAKLVVRRVAGDVLAKVVMRTPVGDPTFWKSPPPAGYVGGRLRANWATSYGTPKTGATDARDQTGGATIASGQGTINRAPDGATIYIMNNLPYAIPIEYGHSQRQAPQGMVRRTVVEFQSFVDNAVKSLPQ